MSCILTAIVAREIRTGRFSLHIRTPNGPEDILTRM